MQEQEADIARLREEITELEELVGKEPSDPELVEDAPSSRGDPELLASEAVGEGSEEPSAETP